MSNEQYMRLKTIQSEYLQHSDKTVEEAKNITRLMTNINKKKDANKVYRNFLDVLTFIKYLELNHSFKDRHGFSHVAEMLIELWEVCHKQPYGKKLIHAVCVNVMQVLNTVEQLADVLYLEAKLNEKSIAYPNGLSGNAQLKIYDLYKKTDVLSKQLVKFLVNTTFALEVGNQGRAPSFASFQKWVAFSPDAMEAINQANNGRAKSSYVYKNERGEKIESSSKGNYNVSNIEAGYNELAREPDFREPNLIERGLSKLFNFRK